MKTTFCILLIAMICSCSSNKDWTANPVNIEEGLHDIEVINEYTLIAYSYGTGSIYKTIDGGKSWDKIYQFDSIYFEQIQFLDDRNGWIAGSPNKIYKTENGGGSWKDKSLKGESAKIYIYGMVFSDANSGFIAAIEGVEKGFVTKIFRTTDGGNSWELINQIPGMILNLENINETIYATGHNVIIKNAQEPGNWEYCFQDTSRKTGQLRDIENNGVDKIISVSFNGYVIELMNDTATTTRITENRIRSIVSFDNDQWIAVGDKNKQPGNMFSSTDNGKNWTAEENDFPDIHRINKSKRRLWIVGKEGLVMSRKK